MFNWNNRKVAKIITLIIFVAWLFVLILIAVVVLTKGNNLDILFGWMLPLPFAVLNSLSVLRLASFFASLKNVKKQKAVSFFTFFFTARYLIYLIPVIISFVVTPSIFNTIATIISTLFFPILNLVLSFVWLPLEYFFINLISKSKRKHVATGDSFKRN